MAKILRGENLVSLCLKTLLAQFFIHLCSNFITKMNPYKFIV